MEQVSSILYLGGYGAYVWPAYGVAAVVLIGLLWRSLATLRANERLVSRLQNPPQSPSQHPPSSGDRITPPAGSPRHEAAR